MSVKLGQIIPWGRTMDEYLRMFQLTECEQGCKILGCGDGPASFNAEMTQRGRNVISCDPIYNFGPSQILDRFEASKETVMSQVKAHLQNYVWTYHRTPEQLLRTREQATRTFLSDYALGTEQGRYVKGELPRLPFANNSFDLAICSHLLFLYSNVLSLEFHCQSILELLRVAPQLRIFPVTALDCEISPHLKPMLEYLQNQGHEFELVEVDYQLQRNGNGMLRVMR